MGCLQKFTINVSYCVKFFDKIRAELPIFLTGVIKVYGREGVPDIFQVKQTSYHDDKLRFKRKKNLILFLK